MNKTQSTVDQLIEVGYIASAHGIKGEVKIRSFTNPAVNIFNYSKLYDQINNQYYIINNLGISNKYFISSIQGITNRQAASLLVGTKLLIKADQLVNTKADEFFYYQLIDLIVLNKEMQQIAKVIKVDNFGAGDLLLLQMLDSNQTQYLSFDKKTVLEINVDKKYLIIELPEFI